MLTFNKEIAQELIAITHTSFPLDEYAFRVKDPLEDNTPFKLFHNDLDEEGELLVIAFLDNAAVIQKVSDDKFTIVNTIDLQSSVESSSVETRTTLIDGNSKSEMILTADKIYLNAETTSDEDIPEAPQQETTVVVYTNNAQTLIFHGVSNFQVTSTGYGFDYLGKATGITRHAVFNNASTAGYAIAKEVL